MTAKRPRGRPPNPDLTAQQRLFCVEYILDFKAREAAIRSGYSEASASSQASRLLADERVQAEIARLMEERTLRASVNADWVLARLYQNVTADMSDLFNVDQTLKEVHRWPDQWRQGLVAGVKVTEVNGDPGARVTEVKMADRTKLLEMLGKHVGVQAFRDKLSVENPDGTPLQFIIRDMTKPE